MKAVIIEGFGGVDQLKLVHDFPKPQRKPGQVLIRTASVGVNPVDAFVRAEGNKAGAKLPKVLGGDVAGTVDEVDDGSRFKVGDAVAALTPGFMPTEEAGTYAEYVVANEEWLASVPTAVLPLEHAGALPLVGLTAWQALHAARPQPGQRVLVLAASGGVGHMAVQIAKHALGLAVVGVCGPKNTGFVKSLGADSVIDYSKDDDWSEQWTGPMADIVVDPRGTRGGDVQKALKLLKHSGHLSHIMSVGTDEHLLQQLQADHQAGKGPSVSKTFVQPSGAQLQHLMGVIGDGKVKVVVGEELSLEQVARAHELIESGHTRGKIVLLVK